MENFINRLLAIDLSENLKDFPALAILGPRQCGKSTLSKIFLKKLNNVIYIDLERPSDLAKLENPEMFFEMHREKLICLDEIQRVPELFTVMRSVIDENKRNGQFLILGSASEKLIRQSTETLAGRIIYHELTPFLFNELLPEYKENIQTFMQKFWLRGGFPGSFSARNDKVSFRWSENFIRTFLERDIVQLGFSIPAETLRRLWKMIAHSHGQILNTSQLGSSLGLSHTTVRKYIDLLAQTFMIRILQPFENNLKKRLVKSPKVYIRDSGILHTLLGIESFDDLLGHPIFGASWEGLIIENIITNMPYWDVAFYRTSGGAEIDLILKKASRTIAVECKSGLAPKTTKGFWNALKDLTPDETWIIAPVKEMYPIKKNVYVGGIKDFLEYYQ